MDLENYYNPFQERKISIEQWKNSASMDIEETIEILNITSWLVKMSLRSKDAPHLACAIAAKCDYFITTDDSIIKKCTDIKEIKVINPVNFLMEIEE